LADADQKLLGRIDPDRVMLPRTPAPPEGLVEGFRALGDASALVSDVLDELGIQGAVAASQLQPCLPGKAMVGVALTLRNETEPGDFAQKAARGAPMGMQDIVAHNLAAPGNVLVVQGVAGISNLGGMSALIGKRQGEVGAIVDGGVRDVADFNSAGYAVWATGVTPVTGRWRIHTTQINGPVSICGIAVAPGDIVVADGTGVAFVPLARAAEVLLRCQDKLKLDDARCAAIARGDSLETLFGPASRKTK
jgi:regulator of RNase E activity RraA